jgi:hypothetical protein
MSVEPDDGNVEVTGEWVWFCPFCEVAFDSEDDAYIHTYQHQDKAPYAYVVLDECFQKIPLVEPRAAADGGDGR